MDKEFKQLEETDKEVLERQRVLREDKLPVFVKKSDLEISTGKIIKELKGLEVRFREDIRGVHGRIDQLHIPTDVGTRQIKNSNV
jgi:hypothetical protein